MKTLLGKILLLVLRGMFYSERVLTYWLHCTTSTDKEDRLEVKEILFGSKDK